MKRRTILTTAVVSAIATATAWAQLPSPGTRPQITPGTQIVKTVDVPGYLLLQAVEKVNRDHGGTTNRIKRKDYGSNCTMSPTGVGPWIAWEETRIGTKCEFQLLLGGNSTSKMKDRCTFTQWRYVWERGKKGDSALPAKQSTPPGNFAKLDFPKPNSREKYHFFRVWEDPTPGDGITWQNNFEILGVRMQVPATAPNFGSAQTLADYCFE